jgi:hypothetical protein
VEVKLEGEFKNRQVDKINTKEDLDVEGMKLIYALKPGTQSLNVSALSL